MAHIWKRHWAATPETPESQHEVRRPSDEMPQLLGLLLLLHVTFHVSSLAPAVQHAFCRTRLISSNLSPLLVISRSIIAHTHMITARIFGIEPRWPSQIPRRYGHSANVQLAGMTELYFHIWYSRTHIRESDGISQRRRLATAE